MPRPRVSAFGVAALSFAAAALISVSPTLVGGKLLSPGTANLVLSDVLDVLHPWWSYAREVIRSGHLPAWNPYALSGVPFYANPQVGVLAPFNLPVWVFPFKYGIALSVALKLWVASIGMYALVRTLGLGFAAALVAGFAYGWLPLAVLTIQYPFSSVWVFAPLMLCATEGIMRGGSPRNVAGLALAAAAAFLGGHPESAAHVSLVVVVYALMRGRHPRRLALVALGGVLGAMVSAAALVPIAANLHDASWATGRGDLGAFHMPLASARTLLFPDWWGRPTGGQIPGAPMNFLEGTLYPGAVALALAVVGVAGTPWRRTLPWLVLAAIGLMAALGVPPVYWVLKTVPPFDISTNTRLAYLLGLSVVVLAAYGVQRILEAERPPLAAVLPVAVGVIVFVAQTPSLHELRLLGNHFRTRTVWPQVITLSSIAWFVGLTALVLVAAVARRRAGVALLVAAVLLDLGHFGRNWNPFTPEAPAAAARPIPDRVLVLGLQPDRQLTLRLRDPRGYDPPLPRMPYYRLWQRAVPGQGLSAPLEIGPPANDPQQRLLRVLSVRTIIAPDGRTIPDPAAAPRAFLPATVRSVPNALDAIYGPGFTAGRDAVVQGPAPPAARGTVRIAHELNSRVDLQADLQRGGLVVLNDTLDTGWSVRVDGRDAQPLRVNSVMRGVQVPAGAHTISWRYRVPGLRAGLLLSVLGLLGVAALARGARRPWRRAAAR